VSKIDTQTTIPAMMSTTFPSSFFKILSHWHFLKFVKLEVCISAQVSHSAHDKLAALVELALYDMSTKALL
jgi:hypothetical protein